ncbi:MAG: hypothetical protein DRI83_13010 [Bacteroidetes bacterium]|nr:MAG: hypothetical protein DRI83_13010 [Bacteroidota bacterium]
MRLLIYIILIQAGLIAGLSSHAMAQEATAKINKAIKAGDAGTLSKHFNSTLDISIPGTDQTMSKSHATQVMKNFFKANPPQSYVENHSGSSREATKYIIGTYKSAITYKTYILLKEKEGKYLIVQLQFEAD